MLKIIIIVIQGSKIKKETYMGCLISNMESHQVSSKQNAYFFCRSSMTARHMTTGPTLYLLTQTQLPNRTLEWPTNSTKTWAQVQQHPGCRMYTKPKADIAYCFLVIRIRESGSPRVEVGLASLPISPSHPPAEFLLPSPTNLDSTGLEVLTLGSKM